METIKEWKNILSDTGGSIREQSIYWLFSKTKEEQYDLRNKYYPDVSYSEQRWFHFTFWQIEDIYIKENISLSEK